MNEKIVNKEFSLGPGSLYIAGGRTSERDLELSGIKAGDTDGGCVIKYEYKTKEICDIGGVTAAILRYGEKVKVSGRLLRISSAALPLLMSDGGEEGCGVLSALFICPLPDGDYFRMYLSGGALTGCTFKSSAGGGLDFEITCGNGLSKPEFVYSGADGTTEEGGTLE